MKRGILLLLTLLLLLPAAALADMDNDLLESTEGMLVYLDNDQINTIIRPEDQPFEGEVDMPYAYVRAYVDFVERPNDHATLMRLLVGLESEEPQYASELRVTVGGTTYCFPVETVISEYDMIYFEDYSVYFTDESLPMLKAIARAKSDTYDVTLLGEQELHMTLTLPGREIAVLYDLYVDAGGTAQELTYLRETFPVTILK